MSNEEFEDLFGNVPFENIRKINEYIDKNFISKQVIRDKINELEILKEDYRIQEEVLLFEMTKDKINILNKILEKGE